MEGFFNKFPQPSREPEREEALPIEGAVPPPEAVQPTAEELARRAARLDPPTPSGLSPEDADKLNDTLRNLGL